jgi:hypothetical protein
MKISRVEVCYVEGAIRCPGLKLSNRPLTGELGRNVRFGVSLSPLVVAAYVAV